MLIILNFIELKPNQNKLEKIIQSFTSVDIVRNDEYLK